MTYVGTSYQNIEMSYLVELITVVVVAKKQYGRDVLDHSKTQNVNENAE